MQCCDVCPSGGCIPRSGTRMAKRLPRPLEVPSKSQKGGTQMPSCSRATPKSSSAAEDGEVQRDTPTSTTACLHQSKSRCADGAKGGSTGTPAKRKGHLQRRGYDSSGTSWRRHLGQNRMARRSHRRANPLPTPRPPQHEQQLWQTRNLNHSRSNDCLKPSS